MVKKKIINQILISCACGCGQQLEKFDNRGRERKMIHGHTNRNKISPYYKTGRHIQHGYIMIYDRSKKDYVREHRKIFEEYYKCSLLPYTHIHHINGDRSDNRIENLEALTNSKHSQLTMMIRWKN